MRQLVPLLVLLVAAPAAAEVWTWTDASGEAHYTDDPSTIPEADRKNAHPMGEGSGGTVNVVHEERDAPADEEAPPPSSDADRLQAQKEQLEGEVTELKHQLANAEREVRKYSAGGRAGAADAAEKARALVDDMKKQLAQHQRDLAVVLDQLKQLEPATEP